MAGGPTTGSDSGGGGEGKGRGREGCIETSDVILLEVAPFVASWYEEKIWSGIGTGSSKIGHIRTFS